MTKPKVQTRKVFIITTPAGSLHYGFMEVTEKLAEHRAEEVFGRQGQVCLCGCGKKFDGFRVVRATLTWTMKGK